MQEQAVEESESYSISAKRMCIIGLKKANLKLNECQFLKLDELYCFVGEKGTSETKENTYITTTVSRMPCQIVGFDVAFDKFRERIQKIVANAPAEVYCTDDLPGYVNVVYPGNWHCC